MYTVKGRILCKKDPSDLAHGDDVSFIYLFVWETSSDLAGSIAGKTTLIVPAILYGSNFTFPPTGGCEIDAKKIAER